MSVEHKRLAQWISPTWECDDLGKIKQWLKDRGVNSRGWRIYLDYGDALFLPLELTWIDDDRTFTTSWNAIDLLRLLQACEMDVPPPPVLLESMRDWGIPEQKLSLVPPLFLRAVWKATVAIDYPPASE